MGMKAELHSIIAVISVLKFQEMEEAELLQKQIVFANKVLLTFVDKASEKETEEVEKAVRCATLSALFGGS
jgi:G3E family GTPase